MKENNTGQTANKAVEVQKDAMLPDLSPSGGGVIGLALTVVGAILYLRRKISRDGLEVAKDSAENKMLKTAISERDKAMATANEAWRSRAEDAKLIGKLSSDVVHLSQSNETMAHELTALRQEIRDLRETIKLLTSPHTVNPIPPIPDPHPPVPPVLPPTP